MKQVRLEALKLAVISLKDVPMKDDAPGALVGLAQTYTDFIENGRHPNVDDEKPPKRRRRRLAGTGSTKETDRTADVARTV
jgi:hypothetical protein